MAFNDVNMKVEDGGLSYPVSPDENMGITYRFAFAHLLGVIDLVKTQRALRAGVVMPKVWHRQLFDWLYGECTARHKHELEVEVRMKGSYITWCTPDVVVFVERDGEVVVRQLVAGPNKRFFEAKVGMPSCLLVVVTRLNGSLTGQ